MLSQIFQISTLEGRVYKLQNQIDSLLYKLNSACDIVRSMQQKVNFFFAMKFYALLFLRINTISVQLKDRDRQLKRYAIDKQRTLQRCDSKMRREADRMINETDMKLREQHKRLTVYFNLQTYIYNVCLLFLQANPQLFLSILEH